MLETHRNPNWKEFLKSCESFLRKSQFSTLNYLNPRFGGSWDMLGIFFVNVIFIMLQKKSFDQKNFWISCTGSKMPFCQNWKIAKTPAAWHTKESPFLAEKWIFKAVWSSSRTSLSSSPFQFAKKSIPYMSVQRTGKKTKIWAKHFLQLIFWQMRNGFSFIMGSKLFLNYIKLPQLHGKF